jgi:hypothetical protein
MTQSKTQSIAKPTGSIEWNESAGATFNGLCAVGFLARASYGLARTPVLALFAASLGIGGLCLGSFRVPVRVIVRGSGGGSVLSRFRDGHIRSCGDGGSRERRGLEARGDALVVLVRNHHREFLWALCLVVFF